MKIVSSKMLMIGGQALVKLGSNRTTADTDYLINDTTTGKAFIHDVEADTDYCNANGNKFFAAIWKSELKNIGPLASPQALLELKAYSLVQHCLNGNWKKADEAEYDMKFLVRTFNLTGVKILPKYIASGELSEVNHVINSVRK